MASNITTGKTAGVAASNAASSSNTTTTSTTIRSSSISAYSSTSSSTGTANGGGGGDLSASLGAGKVRQMFDERRHRVAGIDKSYPLQPIPQPKAAVAPSNNNSSNSATAASNGNGGVANGNPAKTGLSNKTRVPPISANTKARLAMQQQRQQQQQQENGNAEPFKSVAAFDDNENLLEDEKFPDTISFDEDLSISPIPAAAGPRKLTSTTTKLSGPQNVNSLKLKPVPGRTPATGSLKSSSATRPAAVTKKAPSSSVTSQSAAALSSNSSPAATTAQRNSAVSSGKSSSSRTSTGSRTSGLRAGGSANRKPSATSSVGSAGSAFRSISDAGPVPDGLVRCDICGRNFAEDRIDKHRDICVKTSSKKRKVYDATKHRVQGTDAESFVGKKKDGPAGSKKTSTTALLGAAGPSKGDWRRKHEEFIRAIRAAKDMQNHLAKGGKLSDLPPPPPAENPDYIQCPHCSRRFNQTAADRHIPKCATMLHNKPKPNQATKSKRY